MFKIYEEGKVKLKPHNPINLKYEGSAHQDCNLNVNLHENFPAAFYNWKNYDSSLIFQETGKYDFKINVISKRIEKYASFTIQQPKNKMYQIRNSIIVYKYRSSFK